MKKLFALILALMLSLGCIACKSTQNAAPVGGSGGSGGGGGGGGDNNSANNTPVVVAVEAMNATSRKDIDALLACLPEYNYNFFAGMAYSNGLIENNGQSEKEATKQLLNLYLTAANNDNPVTETDLKGELLTEADYPVDLLAELRDALDDEEAPDSLKPEMLDDVEEVAWVTVSGTITYQDETTEDDTVTVPCVKIDGKWYADLFSLIVMGNAL